MPCQVCKTPLTKKYHSTAAMLFGHAKTNIVSCTCTVNTVMCEYGKHSLQWNISTYHSIIIWSYQCCFGMGCVFCLHGEWELDFIAQLCFSPCLLLKLIHRAIAVEEFTKSSWEMSVSPSASEITAERCSDT